MSTARQGVDAPGGAWLAQEERRKQGHAAKRGRNLGQLGASMRAAVMQWL